MLSNNNIQIIPACFVGHNTGTTLVNVITFIIINVIFSVIIFKEINNIFLFTFSQQIHLFVLSIFGVVLSIRCVTAFTNFKRRTIGNNKVNVFGNITLNSSKIRVFKNFYRAIKHIFSRNILTFIGVNKPLQQFICTIRNKRAYNRVHNITFLLMITAHIRAVTLCGFFTKI